MSLDVKSLFTIIPIEYTLNIIKQSLKNCNTIPNKEKNGTLELIENIIYNNTFQFDNKYFKQIEGVPMGSPISPSFAEIFLKDFEKNFLDKVNLKPKLYTGYVDDMFIVWPHSDRQFDLFFTKINKFHPNLKFTCEHPVNNNLNFLDVTITVKENSVRIVPFYKPTHNGKFLNSNSEHPLSQKIGHYSNLFSRIISLTLEPLEEKKQFDIVFKCALNSGFKENFIVKILNRAKCKYKLNKITTLKKSQISNKNNFISLHWNKKYENLKLFDKDLNKKIIAIIPLPNLGKYFKTKLKDKIPVTHKNGIYKISCLHPNCNEKYISQTKRWLKTRYKEHKLDLINNKIKSVFLPHVSMTGHKIDFENFKLIYSAKDYISRNISESYLIQKSEEKLLNNDLGPKNLNAYKL